ncbi:MAG: RNA chaperone Hfq [Candidatus Riflebacteria bacterium]|nr:RNA chaperone Hfq [Candidatus Riflebacteria bacterium]
MTQYNSKVQNMFLSEVRKKHKSIEVILNTGTSLRGKLLAYDQYSISLSFKDQNEVIYKSAILYIKVLPKKRVGFGPGGFDDDVIVGGPPIRPSSGATIGSPSEKPTYSGITSGDDYFDDDGDDPPPPRKTVKKY